MRISIPSSTTKALLCFFLSSGFAAASGCAHGPRDPLERGLAALEAGDREGARESFQIALGEPESAERARAELIALEELEARELARRDPDAALALYEKMLIRDPGDPRIRLSIGRLHASEGRTDEAIAVLAANPSCGLCLAKAAELRAGRGRHAMAEGDYEAAREDYRRALEVERDPALLIDIAQMYTAADFGTADEAIQALSESYGLMQGPSASLRPAWISARRKLALRLAEEGAVEPVTRLLTQPDPPIVTGGGAESLPGAAYLGLRVDVARRLQLAGHREQALSRVRAVWQEVESDPARVAVVRDGLIAVFSEEARRLMSDDDSRAAVELLTEGLQVDPEHRLLRYQAVLAMAVLNEKLAFEMLGKLDRKDEHWARVEALVRVCASERMLREGDPEGAQAALYDAGKAFPDMIEVRLVRAEILSKTGVGELGRAEQRRLQQHGVVASPTGEVRRLGEALAEVGWLESRFAEPGMRDDPLRMPGFAKRIDTLHRSIDAAYPFEARRLPGHQPRISLRNDADASLTVTVEGPGVYEIYELPPQGKRTVVLSEPGVVSLELAGMAGESTMAWYAEQRTLVTVPLGAGRGTLATN